VGDVARMLNFLVERERRYIFWRGSRSSSTSLRPTGPALRGGSPPGDPYGDLDGDLDVLLGYDRVQR
jgi:hypothetical protein